MPESTPFPPGTTEGVTVAPGSSSRRWVVAMLTAALLSGASGTMSANRQHKGRRHKRRKHKRPAVREDATCNAPNGDSGLSLTLDGRLAQTFTALTSGALVRADIPIGKRSQTFGDFTLQLSSVDAFGIPTNEVLAATGVANNAVPVGKATVSFTFAKPAEVQAGVRYALVLSRPTSDDLAWFGNSQDACAGLSFFSVDRTSPMTTGGQLVIDLHFTTFVRS